MLACLYVLHLQVDCKLFQKSTEMRKYKKWIPSIPQHLHTLSPVYTLKKTLILFNSLLRIPGSMTENSS